MYTYTGFIDLAKEFFFWGILAFLVFNPIFKKNRKEKKWLFGIAALLISSFIGILELSCIGSNNIESFTGEYIGTKGKDGSIVSEVYRFKDEERTQQIDITKNAREELFEGYLSQGKTYTVYYVESHLGACICVRIEEIESP